MYFGTGNAIECFKIGDTITTRGIIFGIGHLMPVHRTVGIGIVIITGSIILEIVITPGKRSCSFPRAFHEIVVLDVCPRRSVAVAHDIATATAPIIYHIIYKLVQSLDFGITGLILDIEIAVKRNATLGLYQTTARVRLQTLTDNRVLNGNVGRNRTFFVPTYRETLVPSPKGRQVIEYHIFPVSNTTRILTAGATYSHTETHITDNDIVCTRK